LSTESPAIPGRGGIVEMPASVHPPNPFVSMMARMNASNIPGTVLPKPPRVQVIWYSKNVAIPVLRLAPMPFPWYKMEDGPVSIPMLVVSVATVLTTNPLPWETTRVGA